MIDKKIIEKVKNATYIVTIPDSNPTNKGFPVPNGTGFFISKNGYFITARHVLEQNSDKETLIENKDIILTKPEGHYVDRMVLVKDWKNFDLVLLKTDFSFHKNKIGFEKKEGFDYLLISFEVIPEGTDIFSFGYPLSKARLDLSNPSAKVGYHFISPRITSAIISSHYEEIGPVTFSGFPKKYVIDKALNYGNSGGPVVLNENGNVISVCASFQPVMIPQSSGSVMIPSLYGISTSLKCVESDLRSIIE